MNASNKRIAITASVGVLLLLALVFGFSRLVGSRGTSTSSAIPKLVTPQAFTDERIQSIQTILQQVVSQREDVMAFLMYGVLIDHVDFSADGKLALVWLVLIDPDTNEQIPTEPGLVIAKRDSADSENWQLILQADANFVEELNQVPLGMLSEEARAFYMPEEQPIPHDGQVFSGYLLPWARGEAKRITGSIGHVLVYKSCPSTCRYAFDFADGTMFPVLAAKGGQVKYAVWKWPNGNTEHANFLVLEDTTTDPTTYQVYYHLAQDSIPDELRVPGAVVYQGQFIGNADDTGYSTGHHLHFHVHTNANLYWGASVDITFDDVSINGGRPRTCAEAAQFPTYGSECASNNLLVSGNGDDESPTGGISEPVANQVITTPVLTVRGWAADNTGVLSAQVMLTYDGNWQAVGPVQTNSPFASDIDLCELGVPDGQFFISLEVTDKSGKKAEGSPGILTLEKKYACPQAPPPCPPSDDQIAVYSDAEYQGTCNVLDVGEYADSSAFPDAGDDNLESVLVGKNVVAYLYEDPSYAGKQEALLSSDENLYDNPIGSNQVSSLIVRARPETPAQPQLTTPLNDEGGMLTQEDAVTLSWQGGESDQEFRSELSGPNNFHKSLDWQSNTSWEVGKLAIGDYTWTVWVRNVVGENQATLTFSVYEAKKPFSSHLEPLESVQLTTAILLTWQVDEGSDKVAKFEVQYRAGDSDWTDWDASLTGEMRQAWFLAEPGQSYAFRIRSVNQDGRVEPYPDEAEATVQVAPNCSVDEYELDGGADNTWEGATAIEVDQSQSHNICGLSDEDWIFFSAKGGKLYRISSEPQKGGAAVGIQLYDVDHTTLLGEQWPEELQTAAQLEWTAPQDGLYYVRMLPLDSRLVGTDTVYRARVDQLSQVFSPPLVCTSLLLPAIWAVIRGLQALKKKALKAAEEDEDDEED